MGSTFFSISDGNRRLALLALTGGLAACMGETGEVDPASVPDDDRKIEVGSDDLVTAQRTPSGGLTVYGATVQKCSTTHGKGLVDQLVAEMNCANPGTMARIDGLSGVTLGAAASPYLQGAAVRALASAAKSAPLTLNSTLRTLPQQYMVYRWSLSDTCGVRVAAEPGDSNHESGLALDVANWSARKTALTKAGFKWFGSGDAVHFTYVGAGAKQLSGEGTLAFKRLWNRNHPKDKLALNDTYNTATETRLKASPASGFAIGASCSASVR